jgi:hypothetical protein
VSDLGLVEQNEYSHSVIWMRLIIFVEYLLFIYFSASHTSVRGFGHGHQTNALLYRED